MCQYSARCPTGRHRPGTVCPYAGRTPSFRSTPPAANLRSRSITGPTGGRRQTAAATTGALSGADAAAWWLFIGAFWDQNIDTLTFVALLVAVAIPALLGGYWLRTCSGWLDSGSRRCRQRRAGLLRRCADHQSQLITWYDIAGAGALLLAGTNLLVFVLAVVG